MLCSYLPNLPNAMQFGSISVLTCEIPRVNVTLNVIDADYYVLLQVDVNTEVGVVRDIRLKELRIYTDYGRCSRPLFIVDKQRLLIKKKDIHALQQRVS